jgi:membrane protein implicated in regulation of membrane protease activity
MNWWLWLAGGLAVVVAELVTPSGFFIIFFGLGAVAVGVLATLEILTSVLSCRSKAPSWPSNLSDVASMIATAMNVVGQTKK